MSRFPAARGSLPAPLPAAQFTAADPRAETRQQIVEFTRLSAERGRWSDAHLKTYARISAVPGILLTSAGTAGRAWGQTPAWVETAADLSLLPGLSAMMAVAAFHGFATIRRWWFHRQMAAVRTGSRWFAPQHARVAGLTVLLAMGGGILLTAVFLAGTAGASGERLAGVAVLLGVLMSAAAAVGAAVFFMLEDLERRRPAE